jgi:hypothetical protein
MSDAELKTELATPSEKQFNGNLIKQKSPRVSGL